METRKKVDREKRRLGTRKRENAKEEAGLEKPTTRDGEEGKEEGKCGEGNWENCEEGKI